MSSLSTVRDIGRTAHQHVLANRNNAESDEGMLCKQGQSSLPNAMLPCHLSSRARQPARPYIAPIVKWRLEVMQEHMLAVPDNQTLKVFYALCR